MKVLIFLLCIAMTLSPVFAMGSTESSTEVPVHKDTILSALYESDISSAREALDRGLVTCVELTQYFLDRIEAYNDTYNCFITLCDNALEEATVRDERMAQEKVHPPLLGIPIVVKDNIAYEGYPTTNGYWRYGSVSWENATVVQTLLDAGAVILGKSNMATAAEEAQFTASDAVGETFNAYGTHLSAGGSSGGSASAVSLNFCYAGLGTDTNASLRYPAVLNGCVSMRTTKGLLDRNGVIILNYTRDVPGVITRSVKDQAIVLGEMTGVNYVDSLDSGALEGKRIGVLQELCYCETAYDYRRESKMDGEIKAAFEEAVANLKAMGAKVFPVSIPNLYTLAENCGNNSSYAISRYLEKYEALFAERDLDAVIFPTYLHTPDNSLAEKGWGNLNYDTFYSNCSLLSSPLGVPEIAIPIGYHSKGAGIGLEIAGRKGEEQLLLNLAYAYTEHFDTRKAPTESAPNLYEDGMTLLQLLKEEDRVLTETETIVQREETLPPTEAVSEEPTEVETTEEDPPVEEPKERDFPWVAVFIAIPTVPCLFAFGTKAKKKKASVK